MDKLELLKEVGKIDDEILALGNGKVDLRNISYEDLITALNAFETLKYLLKKYSK